jgi:hypothetical protein
MRIALGRQPGLGTHRQRRSQGVMNQSCRLLGTYVRAGDDRLQWLADQVRSRLHGLCLPMGGEPALGITRRVRLGFAVTQDPDLHGFGR